MSEHSFTEIELGSTRTRSTQLTFSAQLLVAHPPPDVWSYFCRLEEWSVWSPICRRCRLLGEPGELQQGSVLEIVFAILGFQLRVSCRVIQFDPPDSITWQGQKFGIVATHRYRFEPHGEGTLVSNEERLTGVPVPFDRLIRLWYRLSSVSSKSLAGIKRELDRGAHCQPLRFLVNQAKVGSSTFLRASARSR